MIFKDKDKDKIKEKATQPVYIAGQPERSSSTIQVRTAIEGCAEGTADTPQNERKAEQ